MEQLSDQQLRQRLEGQGFDPGPFSDTTRSYWRKKLIEAERKGSSRPRPRPKLTGFSSDEDMIDYGTVPKRKKRTRKRKVSEPSDSSDEADGGTRDQITQRRADAVSRVKMAGSRLLADMKKAHLRDRRTPWYLRYSLHVLVGALVFAAALLLLRAVETPGRETVLGSRDNLIWCSHAEIQNGTCEKWERLEASMNLSHAIADIADKKAGDAACDGLDLTDENLPHAVSVVQLKELGEAWQPSNPQTNVLEDALRLLATNDHWKLVVMSSKDHVVLDSSSEDFKDVIVVSVNPLKPLLCRLRLAAMAAISHFIVTVFSVIGVVLVFALVRMYVHRQEKQQQQVFALVDRVLDLLACQYRGFQRGNERAPYVAISHVRDILLSPSQRQSKSKVWENAASWIDKHESRVRVETRRIAGEDFLVWRWIDISESDGRMNEAPHSPTGQDEPDGGSTRAHIEKLRRREQLWGEHVLDHYPSASWRQQVTPLSKAPSPCLKLRNLFAQEGSTQRDDFEEIESCVLHKLTQHGGVLHCFLDRWSDEGALYAKLDSCVSTTRAIESLHGTWFGGRLVKAEYVPLTEYHRLFPSSRTASKMLYPS